MLNNQTFNLSRFGQLLKTDLVTNRKSYFYRFLGEYLAFMLAAILWTMTIDKEFDSMGLEICTLFTWGSCFIIFGFLCLRSASLILECMNNKEKSLHYLSLPASNFEKFMVRTSISTFLFILVATPIAFLLTEGTRLQLLIMIHDVELNTPHLFMSEIFVKTFKEISDYSESTTNSMIVFTLGSVFLHSLFILGGCLWRKHAMLKTIGALFVFSYFIQPLLFAFIPKEVRAIILSPWVIYVVIAGLTLLCWWGSYRLFCRKQVI